MNIPPIKIVIYQASIIWMEDWKQLLPTTKTARMMIGWAIMVFTVARMMMMMAILLTTHQTGDDPG